MSKMGKKSWSKSMEGYLEARRELLEYVAKQDKANKKAIRAMQQNAAMVTAGEWEPFKGLEKYQERFKCDLTNVGRGA